MVIPAHPGSDLSLLTDPGVRESCGPRQTLDRLPWSVRSHLPSQVDITRLADETETYDAGGERHEDRVPKTVVDVPRAHHECGGDEGKESTKPAVADVIRQAHR